jgi:hypothetical protein
MRYTREFAVTTAAGYTFVFTCKFAAEAMAAKHNTYVVYC